MKAAQAALSGSTAYNTAHNRTLLMYSHPPIALATCLRKIGLNIIVPYTAVFFKLDVFTKILCASLVSSLLAP
jgi:hypothetical protein